VHRFDKRWLAWDGDANQITTKDKKYIWVDSYARWRISDLLRFYQRVRDERGGQSRLDDIIDGETRNAVAASLSSKWCARATESSRSPKSSRSS
jgi:membrane protease subunit HflC